jgi:hypothetical protein
MQQSVGYKSMYVAEGMPDPSEVAPAMDERISGSPGKVSL